MSLTALPLWGWLGLEGGGTFVHAGKAFCNWTQPRLRRWWLTFTGLGQSRYRSPLNEVMSWWWEFTNTWGCSWMTNWNGPLTQTPPTRREKASCSFWEDWSLPDVLSFSYRLYALLCCSVTEETALGARMPWLARLTRRACSERLTLNWTSRNQ